MKTNEETSLEVLKRSAADSGEAGGLQQRRTFATLKEYVSEKGYKNGYVMWPVRTAVSGKQNTPGGATEIMEVLGKKNLLIASVRVSHYWRNSLWKSSTAGKNPAFQFNEAQKKAVCHQDRPCMVLAGPGSGKTAVITGRLEWMIQVADPAQEILVITLPNMRSRR